LAPVPSSEKPPTVKMSSTSRKMASPSVTSTSSMGASTAAVVSKARSYVRPGGKVALSRSSSATTPSRTWSALEVLEPHQRAVLAALHDDVPELLRRGEPPLHAQGELVVLARGRGRLAHLARAHLHVLRAQRAHHVRRRQPPARQRGGVQPQAHGEAPLAEDAHVAHAPDAQERVPDVDVRVVAEEARVVAARRVEQAEGHEQLRLRLVDGDTQRVDLGGQLRRRDGHAVLHVHRGEVQVTESPTFTG
jgi:hypothetical protein